MPFLRLNRDMQVIKTIQEMQKMTLDLKKQGKTIGFVPTMGALHNGHLSLIKKSRADNNISIVSIFVNPTQFAPHEDLSTYPRTPEKDEELIEEYTDYLFYPTSEEIYPPGFETYVKVENLSDIIEGISRPTHYEGVTTVVLKLFNITQPTVAYFGQKDYQQCIVIKKLVADLNFPVEIKMMPIIRSEGGLALSSRNRYLSDEEKGEALGLSKALNFAKELIANGEINTNKIKEAMLLFLKENKQVKIDFIEIRKADDLSHINEILPGNTVILIAGYMGKTRLIDNILI